LKRSFKCPRVLSLRSLRRDESVKYPGLRFCQESVEAATVHFLDERLFDEFLQWFRRARTLRGGLLVALTMVLSQLWHYTVHVNISAPTVRRWQGGTEQVCVDTPL
jgi:hypothetical protein